MRRLCLGFAGGLLTASLAGCDTIVTTDDYDLYKNALDQDGDRASLGGGGGMPRDCDDHDPTRSPVLEEVPYNGLDEDCDDLDLVDADDDGYPYLSRQDWDDLGGDPAWWPTDVTTDPLAIDCEDDDASVHPNAPETWYDGVDADCRGNDDFDQDGDGYVPAEHADETTLPGGDCDDQQAQVNPGIPASADAWYDGTDQDCDCANDFDQDGDGAMAEGTTAAQFDAMAARFPDCDFGTPRYDDCQDAAAPQGFAADQIHPGAPDDWYDGADSDCDGRDDFDQDGDGYFPTEYAAEHQDFLAWWGYPDLDGDGDCDDGDAAVHPGTLEAVGDAVDQDCDGAADGTAWAFGEATWSNPTEVAVVATDLHYLVATAGDDVSTSTTLAWPAIAMWFERDAGYDAVPTGQVTWHNPSATAAGDIGGAFDLLGDGDRFYAAIGYHRYLTSSATDYTYLVAKEAVWSESESTYKTSSLKVVPIPGAIDAFDDVELYEDPDGYVWAIGCGASYWAFGTFTQVSGAWDKTSGDWATLASPSAACFVDAPATSGATTAVATVCTGASCTSHDLDRTASSITTSTAQPHASSTWDVVHDAPEWRVTVDGGAARIDDGAQSYAVLADRVVHTATAVTAPDGDVYVLAVTDDATADGQPDVVLAYGDPAATMTTLALPLTDGATTWAPHAVDLYADASRVILAVAGTLPGGSDTGTDDVVAWMFLEAP